MNNILSNLYQSVDATPLISIVMTQAYVHIEMWLYKKTELSTGRRWDERERKRYVFEVALFPIDTHKLPRPVIK